MSETTDLTAEECYKESAKALRDHETDAANNWRLLGDSVATRQRSDLLRPLLVEALHNERLQESDDDLCRRIEAALR